MANYNESPYFLSSIPFQNEPLIVKIRFFCNQNIGED